MKSRTAALGIALVMAAAFTACGSDEPTVDEAKADFCQSIADAADAEATLTDISVDTTLDDVESAVADLEAAVAEVRDAAQEVGQAEADALQTAYEDLQSSVSGIGGSETIGEAAASVATARDTFVAQWEAIRSQNCGGALIPTTTGG